MARRYTKDSVETRYYRESGTVPVVNVKAYSYPSCYQVEDAFKCSANVAEKALEFAFEMAQQSFWEDVGEWATEIFDDYTVRVYSVGRSGGYVWVKGLPDFETWDAVLLAKWRKFEKWCKSERDYLCSWERVREDIEANRWAEDGAQAYNFGDTKDGKTFCYVDLHKAELEALHKARHIFLTSL